MKYERMRVVIDELKNLYSEKDKVEKNIDAFSDDITQKHTILNFQFGGYQTHYSTSNNDIESEICESLINAIKANLSERNQIIIDRIKQFEEEQ